MLVDCECMGKIITNCFYIVFLAGVLWHRDRIDFLVVVRMVKSKVTVTVSLGCSLYTLRNIKPYFCAGCPVVWSMPVVRR